MHNSHQLSHQRAFPVSARYNCFLSFRKRNKSRKKINQEPKLIQDPTKSISSRPQMTFQSRPNPRTLTQSNETLIWYICCRFVCIYSFFSQYWQKWSHFYRFFSFLLQFGLHVNWKINPIFSELLQNYFKRYIWMLTHHSVPDHVLWACCDHQYFFFFFFIYRTPDTSITAGIIKAKKKKKISPSIYSYQCVRKWWQNLVDASR